MSHIPTPEGCKNVITPPGRTRESRHRDGRDSAHEPRQPPTRPMNVVARAARATMRDEAGVRCTSRQRNTHSTESREVRYLWHPWCGRSVTVYETLTKGGQPVCRCGVDDQRNDRSLEVPAWMFESALCDHLRVVEAPCVDGQALIALTTVLQTARRAAVLEAQHDSVIAAGGADATVQPPSTSLATDAVSSAAFPPALSDAAAGHPGQGHSPAGPNAPPAGRSVARLRRGAGGAS